MIHDYAKLGLRMGLEIHQQLEGKKLFCSCPTTIRKDAPDFEVKRLEEVIKSKGKFDPERIAAEKDLIAAKAKAAPVEDRIRAAQEKIERAGAPLDAAQK